MEDQDILQISQIQPSLLQSSTKLESSLLLRSSLVALATRLPFWHLEAATTSLMLFGSMALSELGKLVISHRTATTLPLSAFPQALQFRLEATPSLSPKPTLSPTPSLPSNSSPQRIHPQSSQFPPGPQSIPLLLPSL